MAKTASNAVQVCLVARGACADSWMVELRVARCGRAWWPDHMMSSSMLTSSSMCSPWYTFTPLTWGALSPRSNLRPGRAPSAPPARPAARLGRLVAQVEPAPRARPVSPACAAGRRPAAGRADARRPAAPLTGQAVRTGASVLSRQTQDARMRFLSQLPRWQQKLTGKIVGGACVQTA